MNLVILVFTYRFFISSSLAVNDGDAVDDAAVPAQNKKNKREYDEKMHQKVLTRPFFGIFIVNKGHYAS